MKEYRLNIDGKEVKGLPGQTILEVARENDIFTLIETFLVAVTYFSPLTLI